MGRCHLRSSINGGNRATREEHTIPSILLATSTIVGRDEGSVCQHLEHTFHHSSVKRKHVVFRLGRSGGPSKILLVMALIPRIG